MHEDIPPPAYGGPPSKYNQPPPADPVKDGLPNTSNIGEGTIALQPLVQPKQILQPVQVHVQPLVPLQCQNHQILTKEQEMISYEHLYVIHLNIQSFCT